LPATSTQPRQIRPRPLRWYHRGAATLGYALLEGLGATIRLRGVMPESLISIPTDQPIIFCIWHNRLALSLFLYRFYVREQKRQSRLAGMVSASRDGGILARILEHFDAQPVRGSTSRRGPQALLELTTWAERGYDLAITPDGPRGPKCIIQPGIIALAQLTGLPILPVSYRVNWKHRLKSWDRFQIPLPFACCTYLVADPLLIPRNASDAEREHLRFELETRMRSLTDD
jgi:lysophospholipid acyltransferase (LPLAT)-like uncharacterized protein